VILQDFERGEELDSVDAQAGLEGWGHCDVVIGCGRGTSECVELYLKAGVEDH